MSLSGKSGGKIEAVILGNEYSADHKPWVDACMDYPDSISFREVDLTGKNWLSEIQAKSFDILLLKPGGISSGKKKLYDERVIHLTRNEGYIIFPILEEVLIYEDKQYFNQWCVENKVPHPSTTIIESYEEALAFIDVTGYPIVGKTSLGASGSGVEILIKREEAIRYIEAAFIGRGLRRRSGPDLKKGALFKRGARYLKAPSEIRSKINIYFQRYRDRQKGLVILQEYIPHEFEWRVVRIGNSFFAHKKIVKGNKASGSLLKSYENPPAALLSFVKELTDRHNFRSQAVDLFETPGGYLVNEMQCIFGQSDPYQMMVNGIPGRYLYNENKWIFEPGDFARNQCYNLRVEWVIDMLR